MPRPSWLETLTQDVSFGARLLWRTPGFTNGVVSYGVSQRTREVGVRIALGARPRDILQLVMSRGFSLVCAGIGVGLVAALITTRFLDTLVYGVSPSDGLTFGAAAAVLLIVALAAQWVPLRRALRIDPARALRDL